MIGTISTILNNDFIFISQNKYIKGGILDLKGREGDFSQLLTTITITSSHVRAAGPPVTPIFLLVNDNSFENSFSFL